MAPGRPKQNRSKSKAIGRPSGLGRYSEGSGRKRIYESVDELEDAINSYFDMCRIPDEYGNRQNPTISGLTYYLGFTHRQTLTRHYMDRPECQAIVETARLRIEDHLEQRLHGANVTGVIFILKNHFGWRDQSSLEIGQDNTKQPIIINTKRPEMIEDKTNG